MDVEEALTRINYALRGTDDEAPTFGTEEADYWLSLLNSKKDELYRDPKHNWDEIFEIRSLGTVIASSSPVFNLPIDFIAPSGDATGRGAYISKDGIKTNLELAKHQEARESNRVSYIAGRNPEKLYINGEIKADDLVVGGELFLPGYYMPTNMTSSSDKLPFPDPLWGCIAVAADIAFGDITYEDKAEGLNAKANSLYMQMLNTNARGVHGSPRRIGYSVSRIRGF